MKETKKQKTKKSKKKVNMFNQKYNISLILY